MSVLDLGCGTGKQLFALAPLVGSAGRLVGVDIASSAVDEVNERAKASGAGHISAVRAALDDVPSEFAGATFDLILSTYAIYYSVDAAGLLCRLRNLLAPDGVAFVAGPGEGTNREVDDLVAEVLPTVAPPVQLVLDFMDPDELARLGASYAAVQTVRLENQIRFTSPDEVLRWWRNHNSYRSEADNAMSKALDRHFSRSAEFVLTKNVLGVHLHV